MLLWLPSCGGSFAHQGKPAPQIACDGFAPIGVTDAEIRAIFADPQHPDDALEHVPAELLAEIRKTYRAIAAHNRFGRESCADWAAAVPPPAD